MGLLYNDGWIKDMLKEYYSKLPYDYVEKQFWAYCKKSISGKKNR